MPRQFDLKAKTLKAKTLKAKTLKAKTPQLRRSKAGDLEGQQDMGGKHGGQAGVLKPPKRPRTAVRDGDVVPKRAEHKPGK